VELSLYKFNYEFDEDKLMEEAKGTGYVPFTDVGNQTTKQFKEWMSENPHMRDKVIDFYRKMNSRTEVKESWNCPYAISIENYFAELTGFEGQITYDTSKPDGVMQKLLDSSAIQSLGWKPKTNLREGIRETLNAYQTV